MSSKKSPMFYCVCEKKTFSLASVGRCITRTGALEMESLIRTNVFLSEQEREALKRLGRKHGVSMAYVARTIIDRALGIGDPKPEFKFADDPEQAARLGVGR